MKKIWIFLAIAVTAIACDKNVAEPNINVEGFWNVLNDTTFTSTPSNSTNDLFHVFYGDHSFYRLAYSKTADFSNLSLRPNKDSVRSYFQTEGKVLMLPNYSASFNNVIPGNVLISQSDNEMVFTRYMIMRRSTITGEVIDDRTDTIRYYRVTDPVKIAYFNNYLKTYHN